MSPRSGPPARRPGPPGRSSYAPPPARVDPEPGSTYPLVLRTQGYLWWRSLLGVALGIAAYVVISPLIVQLIAGIGFAVDAGGRSWHDYYAAALRFASPVGFLAGNLAIIALIPVSVLLVAYWHGVRPRWLWSVQPGVRWRYLIICLVTSTLGYVAVLALSSRFEGLGHFVPESGFWWYVVVIVLTSPIQALAEEVFFRGYLLQALGSLVENKWFGIVVSALVFTAFHGSQNPALMAERLAFGLLAAILVTKTGGLEAGIAAHVMNNVIAFLLAGLTSSIAQIRAITDVTWLQSGFDILGYVVVAVIAWLVGRAMRLATRT